MDEIEHLLSSLQDHLDAAEAKSLSSDADDELSAAQALVQELERTDLDPEELHGRIEELQELLEGLGDGPTGNSQADQHLDAARRATDRILDR